MTQSRETDLLYLKHVLQCILHVQDDCVGGRSTFDASRTIRDSVLRNLQVMAESTQRLSARVKAAQPGVPWENIAGFRHRLVHDYFRLDADLIWRVVTDHLPTLQLAVVQSIATLDALWNEGDAR